MDGSQGPKKDQKRRPRPTLACVSCRRSKIRCDRQQPCGACTRSRHKTCVFDAPRGPASRRSGLASIGAGRTGSAEPERRSANNGLGPVTPASSTPTAPDHDHDLDHARGDVPPLSETASSGSGATIVDANELVHRFLLLERRVGESTAPREASDKHESRFSRPEPQVIDSYLAADIHAMSKGVVSKTRYFGQSHWMNGVIHFKSMLELFENQSKDAKSEAMAVLNRCKALARSIKAQRTPGFISKLGTNIPPREIADQLVDAYLRTTETVYRVLHVPTFRRDYEQYWATPDSMGMTFVIQLQLIMAIGCTIYDDKFSMRKSAMQWVTEAQYWLLGPPAKAKLTMPALQIMTLLTIARETASVGGDLVWIHVGSLLRSAFYMGLHRDPSRLPKMSRLDAEMRRRLWNTIIELELKTSADSGGFPAISPDTSDTRPPADLDDVSLMEENSPEETSSDLRFTDMSMALALRDSFRERLAIYQMLNATPSRGTYDDTIRLHRRFTVALKALTQKLKTYASTERQPTSFQYRFVEVLTRRCLMSLHLPYLGPGLKDPAYSFSRKQVVDSAVKIYSLVYPASVNTTRPIIRVGEDEGPELLSTEGDDLGRLCVCASGFWRLLGSQPSMIASLELQALLQEDESVGPPTARPDLLGIVRHSLAFYLSRIQAGETNVKGYLFTTALAAHVQAMMEGLSGMKSLEPILSAAIRTERTCFDILKQQLASTADCGADAARAGEEHFNWDTLVGTDEEWSDVTGLAAFFSVTNVESFLSTNPSLDFMGPSMSF